MKTSGAILFCLLLASCKSASHNANVESVRPNGGHVNSASYSCEMTRSHDVKMTLTFKKDVTDSVTVYAHDVGIDGPVELKEEDNGGKIFSGHSQDNDSLSIKDIPENRGMKFSMKFKYHIADAESDAPDKYDAYDCNLNMR